VEFAEAEHLVVVGVGTVLRALRSLADGHDQSHAVPADRTLPADRVLVPAACPRPDLSLVVRRPAERHGRRGVGRRHPLRVVRASLAHRERLPVVLAHAASSPHVHLPLAVRLTRLPDR
jgi:hypothetical protein